ncbi:hypothetical protein [Mycobacterium vicinigordonae]|uniref:Uncharacterized protein n=1 Tax=Mycobacterium vicinigordonae TaxID=1719132 RepID=A0A7D6IJA9_9MYCO|nr:hypothetical protein [Mycobacterium vicinigordonae]QLL05280.1 hypothetical protein H0P51_15445 [Mycobacterium vicinigordonae]
MYIIVVLLQTLILPAVSGGIDLAISGGNPAIVFGLCWAFWGVGTRLFVAGVSQLVNPTRTAQGILGVNDPGAELVVHELGYANLSMGLVAMFSAFAGRWWPLGASAGAVYLGLAGLRHVARRGKNRDENVATWTDLLVFLVVAAGALATFAHSAHPMW